MSKEAEIQYNYFLESGDLKILFPGMKGVWKEDSKRFIKIWEDTQKLVNDAEVDFTKMSNNSRRDT